MPRRPKYKPLRVHLNNRFVGYLSKEPSGAIFFRYDDTWLSWEHALPVSLSLPLREDPYRGEPVAAVFENLLPDSDNIRRRVAEKVGARGTDAYSLLEAIGHDCVGALQFIVEDADVIFDTTIIQGEKVDEADIDRILQSLTEAPLGLSRDDAFRISIAGAQEKTALLWYEGHWRKPIGTTPTTHIFKTQIGQLPNGIDLSNSIENEFYCLKLLEAFGLPVNKTTIETFGETKALVVERFDRRWTKDHRLLRLPQEDCCQALSFPPTRKYQSDHGPGMTDILSFLKGSDSPTEDQKLFLKAQMLFWLIGATDGHAKNFSVFLRSGESFSLTPLYDVLTAQPSLDACQIERKQMRLAMAVGNRNHYRVDEIHTRHFIQTAQKSGLPQSVVLDAVEELIVAAKTAICTVESVLPDKFPEAIHMSVKTALEKRLKFLVLP